MTGDIKEENGQNWTESEWFRIWELLANHKFDEAEQTIKQKELREKEQLKTRN